MRKTKAIFILLLVLFISIVPLGYSCAHSVELDPKELITMPSFIFYGSGSISVDSSVSDYTLFYQGVLIENTVIDEIKGIESSANSELDIIKDAYTSLVEELNNLKTVLENATNAYNEGVQNQLPEDQLLPLKTAYETAQNNYNTKYTECKDKENEYNNKVDETNNKINALTPTYVEANWIQCVDNEFSLDLSQYSGEQSLVLWVKLQTSSDVYYDENIYTVSGNKESVVNVQSVSLDITTLSISEGSTYTLTATITPSDATNKSLTWTSDNEAVATVSNGKVTGVSEGTATIKVTTADGDHSATCLVTVTKKVLTPSSTNNQPDSSKETGDSTIKSGSLPYTGATYVIISAVAIIVIVAFILYKKIKYLDF